MEYVTGVSSGFGHIYRRNAQWKNSFLLQCECTNRIIKPSKCADDNFSLCKIQRSLNRRTKMNKLLHLPTKLSVTVEADI